MKTVLVIDGQSLVDIALQEMGSIEGLVALAMLNGKSVTSPLVTGESIQIPYVSNANMVGRLQDKGVVITSSVQMRTPKLIVLTGSLAFGNTYTDESSTRAFSIINTGSDTLVVSNIIFPFSVYVPDWKNGSIAAGESRLVNVTFAPTMESDFSGAVSILSNADGGQTSLSAQGIGVMAKAGRFDGFNDSGQRTTAITGFTQDSNKTVYFDLKSDPENGGFYDYFYYGNVALTNRKFFIVKTNAANQLRIGNVLGSSFNETLVTIPEITSKCKLVTTQGANQLKVYANGVLKTTAAWTTLGTSSVEDVFYIGRLPSPTNWYKGNIKRIKIFNRVLSAAEVAAIDTVTAGLIHHWDFNDLTGATLPDRVGNNHLVLSGALAQINW